MKKNGFGVFLVLLLMLCPVLALADGPVLLVDLPEDAQMVENIEFEDGDFIQTYQLPGGTNIQLLRYAYFDMSSLDLAQSEWVGFEDAQSVHLDKIGGYEADALSFRYTEDGNVLLVTTVVVRMEGQTLVFEAVCPEGSDENEVVEQMLRSLDLSESQAFVG